VTQETKKTASKLEIANELYKFAFQVKKQKFKEKLPDSPPEIEALTKQYLHNLKEHRK